jgi:hypothetical protein
MSLLDGAQVTVETKYLPPLVIPLGGQQPVEPGVTGYVAAGVTALMKPKVTVTYQGQVLYQAAPAGDPAPNQWPLVQKVLIGLVGFLVLKYVIRVPLL